MAKNFPQPPRPLGKDGLAVWERLVTAYDLSDAEREALQILCAAVDRAESCRRRIDADGEFLDKKAHPLLRDEAANRAIVIRILDKLGAFDDEADTRPGHVKRKDTYWHGKRKGVPVDTAKA